MFGYIFPPDTGGLGGDEHPQSPIAIVGTIQEAIAGNGGQFHAFTKGISERYFSIETIEPTAIALLIISRNYGKTIDIGNAQNRLSGGDGATNINTANAIAPVNAISSGNLIDKRSPGGNNLMGTGSADDKSPRIDR
jgi:hypothetical protein